MARCLILILLLVTFKNGNLVAAESLLKKEAGAMLENERNSISVFQSTVNSVVNVSNMKTRRNRFDFSSDEVEAGMGSGLVWDKAGFIVTNFHVVAGGDSFLITFKDNKKQFRAKLVGGDPTKDLAVLKLNEIPQNLNPVSLGESKTLLVGQKALAIGNPLGFDHSLTTGSISALDRSMRGYAGVTINGMIQTDASINPGNSGGALLDSQGKLIGINAMLTNASGINSSAGLGFAIPIDTVKSIVPQLIQYGKVIRPGLGLVILEENYSTGIGGAIIKYVDPKGPAAKVGLKGLSRSPFGEVFLGDIITAVDEVSVKNYDDLFSIMDKHKIGDVVKIKYIRDEQQKTVSIKLVQI